MVVWFFHVGIVKVGLTIDIGVRAFKKLLPRI
jgi:hypothetical protein